MITQRLGLVLLVALLLTLSTTPAQGQQSAPPTAADMIHRWREAMDPRSEAPAYSRYQSIERGQATRTETWVTPDGARYRRRIDRGRDGEEWLLTPEHAQMRDWNGFVREIDGAELLRLRAEAVEAALLAFGPRPGLGGEVIPNTIDGQGGWALRVAVPGGSTDWVFDGTGTPYAAASADPDGERTTRTYRWWSVGAFTSSTAPNRRLPTAYARRAGEDAIEYAQGDGWFERRPRHVFDALEGEQNDAVMLGFSARVPFTMAANHIIVETRVNGHAPIGFLVDTGAAVTNLNAARMRAFGVTGYGQGEIQGGGGATQNTFVEDVSYTLPGGVRLLHQHAKAIDMSGLERAWGVPLGGILGYDFLSRFVVEIDYANDVMTLHRPERWRYRGGGVAVPITFDRGTPYAEATLSVSTRANLPARLLMDNGLADTMVFTRPYVEANDLARLAGGAAALNTTAGLENQFFAQRNTRGRIDEIRLGDLVLRGVPANFSTNTSGAYASASFAATFGNTIFSRYRMFIDYPHRRFIFEPTPAAAVPFAERRTFGVTLLAGGDDLRTFTVSGLRAGSPAAAAGFQQNDVIAGVDERDATRFTLQALRDLLLREGEHHVFQVRRGGETLTIAADVTLVSIER
jgi:hypothetical protein